MCAAGLVMQPRALSNVPAQFWPRVAPDDVSQLPPYDSAAPSSASLHAHRSMSAVVAGAELQLSSSGGGLEDRFAQLEAHSGTDEALNALKAKMGLAAPAPTPQLEGQRVNAQVPEPVAVGANSRPTSTSTDDLDF